MGVDIDRFGRRRFLGLVAGAVGAGLSKDVRSLLQSSESQAVEQQSECCVIQTGEYHPPVFTPTSGITTRIPEPSPTAIIKSPIPSLEPSPSPTIVPTPKPSPSPFPTEVPKIIAELPAQKENEASFPCSVYYYHEINKASFTRDMMNALNSGDKSNPGESISVDKFWEVMKGRSTASQNAFMVTMDDSLKSQKQALEAVKEIEAKTNKKIFLTLFCIMGFPGHGDKTIEQLYNDEKTRNEPIFGDGTHNYFTIQDLLDFLKEGHSIQNHTISHPYLSRITEEQMQNEILYAEARLDQLYALARKLYGPQIQRKVKVVASPFGQQVKREEDFFAKANLDLAFSTFTSKMHTLSKRFHLGRVRVS